MDLGLEDQQQMDPHIPQTEVLEQLVKDMPEGQALEVLRIVAVAVVALVAQAQIHLVLEAMVVQERHRVLVVPLFIMAAEVAEDHIMEIQAAAAHQVQVAQVEVAQVR